MARPSPRRDARRPPPPATRDRGPELAASAGRPRPVAPAPRPPPRQRDPWRGRTGCDRLAERRQGTGGGRCRPHLARAGVGLGAWWYSPPSRVRRRARVVPAHLPGPVRSPRGRVGVAVRGGAPGGEPWPAARGARDHRATGEAVRVGENAERPQKGRREAASGSKRENTPSWPAGCLRVTEDLPRFEIR